MSKNEVMEVKTAIQGLSDARAELSEATTPLPPGNRHSRRHPEDADQPGLRIALSPAEAADALGLSKPSIYLLLNSGRLPSVRAGARRLIAVSALQRFVDGAAEA